MIDEIRNHCTECGGSVTRREDGKWVGTCNSREGCDDVDGMPLSLMKSCVREHHPHQWVQECKFCPKK
jgi:hypothetical protein